MRLFVDGSESFWRPENRTGIQRVVREVCRRCAAQAPQGVEVHPVQFDGRRWASIEALAGPTYRGYVRARLFAARSRAARRLARAKLKAGPFHPGLFGVFVAGLLGSVLGSVLASLLRRCLRSADPVELTSGDVLLMLDYPLRRTASLEAARRKGVRLVALVYDCVPLSHPRFYRDQDEFSRLFAWLAGNAEGIMTISLFSEQEIRRHLPVAGGWTDHFPLGADFPPAGDGEPRPELRRAVAAPCFLMVGTIAPHKNHRQALDAMELLWAAGGQAHLLIVGKVGWQSDELLGRISAHPELGRRLFVFHDLGDDELAFAYRQSHALIAASYVEGFGLPLVEALGRGLPVLAADIPVFREIGGDAVGFFPLEDAKTLAETLRVSATQPRREVRGWRWPDWDEATRRLLAKVAARLRS